MIDQHAGAVGELPVVEAAEVLVVAPPADLAKLVIGRAGQQDRIAVLKIPRQFDEAGYFGRTHEREVLRLGVDDLPLARKRLLGDRLKRRLAFFLVLVEAGLHAGHAERIDFVAYGFHTVNPLSRMDN